MTDYSQKKKTLKLTQFCGFKWAVLAYFFFVLSDMWSFYELPLWMALILKILPILVLIRFVVLQYRTFDEILMSRFCRNIFFGLVFSLLGDALLVFQEVSDVFFICGLIAFALGHVMYIFAFGWTPLNIKVLLIFLGITAPVFRHLWQGSLPEEPLPLQIGVVLYSLIIVCMNWRSWARLSLNDFELGRFYEFFGCIGSFLFLISDSTLAINKFVDPIPYGDYVIMSTYYAGQLGIALSVVDGPDMYNDEQKQD